MSTSYSYINFFINIVANLANVDLCTFIQYNFRGILPLQFAKVISFLDFQSH